MPSKLVIGAGVVLTLLIAVIVYYSTRSLPTPDGCLQSTACTDSWYDEKGEKLPAIQQCGPDLRIVKPYYGPGKCANPCPANTTPCWNAMKGFGVCVPGSTPCPCATDADCGGAGRGTCGKDGKCVCAPGWSGPACDQQGTTCKAGDPKACGGHGSCVGGRCVCDDGWVDNPVTGAPCSLCGPGRGPAPGSHPENPKLECSAAKYTGVSFPIPVGHVDSQGATIACSDLNDHPEITGQICQQYYGPGAEFAQGLSPVDGPNAICSNCPQLGGRNSSAVLCRSRSGAIWASPSFDATSYNPWGKPGACAAVMPTGFLGVVMP